MNHNDFTQLNWTPVLLIRVLQVPFLDASLGLLVQRCYLAEHLDGILRADWTLPADEQVFPLVQLVGWQPWRDVPFTPPIKFRRQGDPRVISLIPSGTWVLPYDEEQYQLYKKVHLTIHTMLEKVENAPTNAQTLHMLINWIT